jgi:hypothetical protein
MSPNHLIAQDYDIRTWLRERDSGVEHRMRVLGWGVPEASPKQHHPSFNKCIDIDAEHFMKSQNRQDRDENISERTKRIDKKLEDEYKRYADQFIKDAKEQPEGRIPDKKEAYAMAEEFVEITIMAVSK